MTYGSISYVDVVRFEVDATELRLERSSSRTRSNERRGPVGRDRENGSIRVVLSCKSVMHNSVQHLVSKREKKSRRRGEEAETRRTEQLTGCLSCLVDEGSVPDVN